MSLRGVGSNQIMGGHTVNEKSSTKNYVIFCTFVPTKTTYLPTKLPTSSYAPAALTTQQVSDVNSQQGVKP